MIRLFTFLLLLLPSFAVAQQTITFRTAWHTPLHPSKGTKAQFEEGVRQGFAEFSRHYNVNFVERFGTGTPADLYVISFPLCGEAGRRMAGAQWIERPQSCYPWRGIYFNSNDYRPWSIGNFKSVLMHEVMHVVEYGGKNYHSPNIACVSNSNATSDKFCPSEDAFLAARWGRRAPPIIRPKISINKVTLAEGNSGQTPFPFVITLDRAVTQTIKVHAFTSNGTATVADKDYLPVNAEVTFSPGQTERIVTVNVVGDTKPEPDEYFYLNIRSNDGDTTTHFALGVILNDDVPVDRPKVTINSVRRYEGGVGNHPFTFTVNLDRPVTQPINISYFTSDGTAKAANKDYIPATGILEFTPGKTEATVTVQVPGDNVPDNDKYFYVNIRSTDADIATLFGLGIILNDDFTEPLISETGFVDGGASGQSFWQYRVAEPSTVTLVIGNTAIGSRYITGNAVWMFNAPADPTLIRLVANNGQRYTFIGKNYGH